MRRLGGGRGVPLTILGFQDYRTQVKFHMVSIDTKIDKEVKATQSSPAVDL